MMKKRTPYQIGYSDAVAYSMLLRLPESPFTVGSKEHAEYRRGYEASWEDIRFEERLYRAAN